MPVYGEGFGEMAARSARRCQASSEAEGEGYCLGQGCRGSVTWTGQGVDLDLRPPADNALLTLTLLPADHFTAKLSVRMTSGPDFVATNFTFFDCNTYISCTQCVSSSFPCDWCVDGHRCTHDTAENCRNDILVTGVSVSICQTLGPHFCVHSPIPCS